MMENRKRDNQAVSEETIHKALQDASSGGELSCAAAFGVAETLNISPSAVGDYADELGLHLAKCQLGLFGHSPQKKIVRPLESVDDALAEAIREGLVNDRLSCQTAWEIADKFDIPRMKVSSACETLGGKIKPCQIGAF